MFVIKQPGKHLVCIGSSVIHMTKGFEDYNCLVSLLKTHYANFKALLAFGTDGEFKLANEFLFGLPDAIHLLRKIYMSENIERTLVKLSFDKDGGKN